MWLFHHYFSPPPSQFDIQPDSLSNFHHRGREGRRSVQWEFSHSLSVTVSSTEVPLCLTKSICPNDLSADCAQHRAVNTSSAAPGDARQPEFVVDAVEPGTHRGSHSLNPMRWAFLSWPHRRINSDFAADARWHWLLLFLLSSVFCFAGKRRKTYKSLRGFFFLCERAAEMCAPASNAQADLSGVKCVG